MEFPTNYEVLQDLSKFNRFTNSKRFESQKIDTDDGVFYLKKALTSDDGLALRNEVAFGMKFAGNIPGIKIPRVLYYEEDTALFEWVEADLLVSEGMADSLTDSQAETAAKVICALDNIGGQTFPGSSPYSVHFDRLTENLGEWAYAPMQNGLLAKAELAQAVNQIKLAARHVEPALQHGDLLLEHIFATEPPVVYDFEHASDRLPRFGDFARLFTTGFVRTANKDSVVRLIDLTAAGLGMDRSEFMTHVHPLLLAHSIARLNDSVNDRQEMDYTENARQLFIEVFTGTL